MPHDEELAHPEGPTAERTAARRAAKKRRRMRLSGKSVFLLQTLLQKGPKSRRSAHKLTHRRHGHR